MFASAGKALAMLFDRDFIGVVLRSLLLTALLFMLLFAGTATITLEYDILDPLFGIRFWRGGFYLVFSLVLDAAGVRDRVHRQLRTATLARGLQRSDQPALQHRFDD